jgi:hypothetical protein
MTRALKKTEQQRTKILAVLKDYVILELESDLQAHEVLFLASP